MNSEAHGCPEEEPWGVLVSRTIPTTVNGLVQFFDTTQAVSAGDKNKSKHECFVEKFIPKKLRRHFLPTPTKNFCGGANESNSSFYMDKFVLLPLYGTHTSIGRLEQNSIVLSNNPCVSGVHCIISMERNVREGVETNLIVSFADNSTNGCNVNGKKIGKGNSVSIEFKPPKGNSGEDNQSVEVELMNAGKRHVSDYNLLFTFFPIYAGEHGIPTLEKFVYEQLRERGVVTAQDEAEDTGSLNESEKEKEKGMDDVHHDSSTEPQEKAELPVTQNQKNNVGSSKRNNDGGNTQKLEYLLTKARWDISSKVYRMYHTNCEQFYQYENTDKPLGEGGFGVVYSAALRSSSEHDQTGGHKDHIEAECEAMLAEMKRVISAGGGGDRNATRQEQLDALRERYIQLRCQVSPSAVSAAAGEGLMPGGVKRPRTSDGGEEQLRVDSAFCFAVKVIQKKRLFTLLEDDDSHKSGTLYIGDKNVATSAEDREVIQKLILLETQVDEREEARERSLLGALGGPKGEIAHQGNVGPLLLSQGLTDALDEMKRNYYNNCESQNTAWKGENTGEHLPEEARDKQQQREALLARLPSFIQHYYQKELANLRRQQVELQILFSVQHPFIIRLYEMFEEKNQISLVMEKALGGEAWDLLRPMAATGAETKGKDEPGENTLPYALNEEDQTLLQGGPLPEFIVKIIIKQLLLAVRYLHTRGIVHRDLKLENILLAKRIHLPNLYKTQLHILKEKIKNELAKRRNSSRHESSSALPLPRHSRSETEKISLPNPLSLVYYCHLPRMYWPSIKLTDFGLSYILDDTSAQQNKNASSPAMVDYETLAYTKQEMKTSCGTPIYAAPEIIDKQRRRSTNNAYTATIDMYSIGVICFALLTGRTPFPCHKDANTGRMNVDYSKPIDFSRYRKLRRGKREGGVDARPNKGEGVTLLPRLAVAESFNVDVDSLPRENANSEDNVAGTGAVHANWSEDLLLFERKLQAMEEGRRNKEKNASADGGGATRQNNSSSNSHVYVATMEETLGALEGAPEFTYQQNSYIDIERLARLSQEHHLPNAPVVDNRLELPPVSHLGQQFILSLLDLDSSKRPTARQALQHPWLWELRGIQ